MPDVQHAEQYYLFMKWFKTNHPALFAKYQLRIIVPTTYKIMAAMDYVDPTDKKRLQVVIDEYYRNVAD